MSSVFTGPWCGYPSGVLLLHLDTFYVFLYYNGSTNVWAEPSLLLSCFPSQLTHNSVSVLSCHCSGFEGKIWSGKMRNRKGQGMSERRGDSQGTPFLPSASVLLGWWASRKQEILPSCSLVPPVEMKSASLLFSAPGFRISPGFTA